MPQRMVPATTVASTTAIAASVTLAASMRARIEPGHAKRAGWRVCRCAADHTAAQRCSGRARSAACSQVLGCVRAREVGV